MDIELMREFVVFSRYLNFSKAAGKLNLAQPTLSSHMQSMERELGFDLCIASPGIPFWHELYVAGQRLSAEVVSEVEFTWRESSEDSLVENRVYVPLRGMEELLKPCFIYLKANDNPALGAFASFLSGLRGESIG